MADTRIRQFSVTSAELAQFHSSLEALERFGGVAAVASALHVDPKTGISGNEEDVVMRTDAFGLNTFPAKKSKPFWRFLWEACKDETLVMLAICAAVSLIVGLTTEDPSQGWYDGAGIAFAVILVVMVSSVSDYQQSLQFRRLNSEKQKIYLTVSRRGKIESVCIFDLVVGDVIHLNIGDQVPADGLLLSGQSLTLDESSMTGESDPLLKDATSPFLLSGCKVLDGFGSFLVTAVGMNTEWGRVMATLSVDNIEETPLQVRLNTLATMIGKVGLSVAAAVFAVLIIRFLVKVDYKNFTSDDGREIVDFFAIAVTIVVVAIPEGLPLAVTLTLAYSMHKMMDDRALVRHLAACETMGSATAICSDKTGTLTMNKMTLINSWVCGMLRVPHSLKDELNPGLMKILFQTICVNTNGSVFVPKEGGSPEVFGSPTEKAILSWGVELGANFENVRDETTIVAVEAFNSTKKRMGTLFKTKDGQLWVHWKGASEVVLDLCTHYYNGEGSLIPLAAEKIVELKSVINSFASAALRTLCFGCKQLSSNEIHQGDKICLPEEGLVCLAIVGIKDPCRPGVPEAVAQCQRAGIKIRMVTGDNMVTAKAIAAECGIFSNDGTVLEGKDFRNMTVEQQYACLPNVQVMARSSPTDKHILVKRLLEMGEIVAVTGDGTNDAPALHEASIGLAMGIAGTEVAKESSDIIILDDNFASIVKVVRWGRAVYVNIQKFIQFQITVNGVALCLNFITAIVDGQAPLTAVQLLWVNLIMDTLGALALATEPPSHSLMYKKPVNKREPLITNVMWRNIAFQAIYQLGMLLVLQFHGLTLLGLKHDGADNTINIAHPTFATLPVGRKKLITVIFNSFVFCQIFNEVNARRVDTMNIFEDLMSNKIFVNVIVFTCLIQALIVEFAGSFASTVPLSWKLWLLCVGLGFISWPLAAVVKFLPVPKKNILRRWWRRREVLSKKGTTIKRLVVSTSFQSRANDSRESKANGRDGSIELESHSVAIPSDESSSEGSPKSIGAGPSEVPTRRNSVSRAAIPVVSTEAAPDKKLQLAW